MLVNGIQHEGGFPFVDFHHLCQVTLVIVVVDKFIANNLGPYSGVNIAALFAYNHLLHQFFWSNGKAHTHTGGNDLGEGTCINYDTVLIKGFDIWQRLAGYT